MSDATKTGPTGLLDLPGELRDQIWEYVVGDHIIEFENCPWLVFQDQPLRDGAHPQHIVVTKITSLSITVDHEKNLDYPSVSELDPLSNKEFIGLADTNWLAEDTGREEPGLSKLADTYHTYSLALSRVRRDCSSPPLPCASTFLNSLLTSRQIYNEVCPILYGSNMFSFTLNCEFPEDGGDSLCPLYEFLRHRTRAQSSWLKSIGIVTPAPYYVHPWWRRAFTRLPAGQFLSLQSITLCARFGSFMKSFHGTDVPIQAPIPVVCWSLEQHLAELDWLVKKRRLRVKQIKLALKSARGQWGHFRPLSENLLALAERRSGYDPDKFLKGHEYLEITKYFQVLEDGCEDTLQRAENTQAGG